MFRSSSYVLKREKRFQTSGFFRAKRTGAATAVAAKYLARKDSEVVAILGCGVQGYSNLEALNCLFNIKKVKAYDLIAETAKKYAAKIKTDFDLDVEIVASPEEAVKQSDIIVTAGPILKDPNPVIEDNWFKKGAFACPVDFDSYWEQEAFQNADKFYTDDIAQMMYYKKIGYFKGIPKKIIELGDLVAKKVVGREKEDERIISVNLGLALDDMATDMKIPHQINFTASMFQIFFTGKPVVDYATSKNANAKKFQKMFQTLLKNGIFIAPSQFEVVFLSDAHTENDLNKTLDVYHAALKSVKN